MRGFVIILLYLLTTGVTFAQSNEQIAKFKYEEAEELYTRREYYNAYAKLIEVYELLDKKSNPKIEFLFVNILDEMLKEADCSLTPEECLTTTENLRGMVKMYLMHTDLNQDKLQHVYKLSLTIDERVLSAKKMVQEKKDLDEKLRRGKELAPRLEAIAARYNFKTGLTLKEFLAINPLANDLVRPSNYTSNENYINYDKKTTVFGKLWKEGASSIGISNSGPNSGIVRYYSLIIKSGKKIENILIELYNKLLNEATTQFGKENIKVDNGDPIYISEASEDTTDGHFSVTIVGAPFNYHIYMQDGLNDSYGGFIQILFVAK